MQTKPHPRSHQGTPALDALETSHEGFLDVLDHFQNLLRDIHFEGKVRLGGNLKEMIAALSYFKKNVYRHFKLEEEILFPFLKSHIPKLESVTLLLAAEHQDFRRHVKSLDELIRQLKKKREDPAADTGSALRKIRETGMFMTYLLRNHIHAENSLVYKTAGTCLKPHERKLLKKKLAGVLKPEKENRR